MTKFYCMKHKRTIAITAILVVFGLMFSIYVVLDDLARIRGEYDVDLSSPETTINSLERALKLRSYTMLEKIFMETHYSSVFGEFFFGKDIDVWYGYSDDERVSRKKSIESRDIQRIKPKEIKYLTENIGITVLVVQEEINGKQNYFTAAVILQESHDGWKISRFYDFMYLESEYFEVRDFILNHINGQFRLRLGKKETEGARESTILYNFALGIESIEIKYGFETICIIDKDDLAVFMRENEVELSRNSIHNIDTIQIESKCGFNEVITRDRDRKYLIYIMLNKKDGAIPIKYYGDLVQ